jgi:hypothetical protein
MRRNSQKVVEKSQGSTRSSFLVQNHPSAERVHAKSTFDGKNPQNKSAHPSFLLFPKDSHPSSGPENRGPTEREAAPKL